MPDGEAPPVWWRYWNIFDKGRRRGQVDPLEAVRKRISRRLLEEGPELLPPPPEAFREFTVEGQGYSREFPAISPEKLTETQRQQRLQAFAQAQAQAKAKAFMTGPEAKASIRHLQNIGALPTPPAAPSLLERAKQGFQLRPSLEPLKAVGTLGRAFVPEQLGGTMKPFTPEQLRQMAPWEQVLMASIGTPLSGVFPSLQQARAAFTPGAALPIRRAIGTALTKVPLPGAGEAALKVSGLKRVTGAAGIHPKVGEVLQHPQLGKVTVTDISDPALLGIRTESGGIAKVGRETFGVPPAAAPEAAAPGAVAPRTRPRVTRPAAPVTKPVPPAAGQVEPIRQPQIQPKVGEVLDHPQLGRVTVVDISDPALLKVRVQSGAVTQVGRGTFQPAVSSSITQAGRRVPTREELEKAAGKTIEAPVWAELPIAEQEAAFARMTEVQRDRIFPKITEAIRPQQPAREIPKVTPPSEAVTPPIEPSAAPPPVQPPGGRPPTATGGPPVSPGGPEGPVPPLGAITFDVARTKLLRVIKGSALRARGETEALRSAEMTKRAARVEEATRATGLTPQERLVRIRTAQRGELPIGELKLAESFTPQEVEVLRNGIYEHYAAQPLPRGMTAANIDEALSNLVLHGKIPRRFELEGLEAVFGRELVRGLLDLRSGMQKGIALADAIWFGLQKALIASFDHSAVGRQGFMLYTKHPVASTRALVDSVKAMASERLAMAVEAATKADSFYPKFIKAGWNPRPLGEAAPLARREEMFMFMPALRQIPLLGPTLRVFERGFSTFLNRQSFQSAKVVVRGWERIGIREAPSGYVPPSGEAIKALGRRYRPEFYTPRDLETLADLMNAASGRGSLGKLEGIRDWLNRGMFSAGFFTSRFQTATSLITATPLVRREVIGTWVTTLATGSAILTAAKFAGAKVELDPRSPFFGRIKVGPITIDIWAGYQPIVRYLAQAITGQRKTMETGEIVPAGYPTGPGRVATVVRFARTKANPGLGALWDYLEGHNIMGEKVPQDVGEELKERFLPMIGGAIWDAAREEGLLRGLLLAGLPEFFGFGAFTIPQAPGEAGGAPDWGWPTEKQRRQQQQPAWGW